MTLWVETKDITIRDENGRYQNTVKFRHNGEEWQIFESRIVHTPEYESIEEYCDELKQAGEGLTDNFLRTTDEWPPNIQVNGWRTPTKEERQHIPSQG